jgi:hypothetical protein
MSKITTKTGSLAIAKYQFKRSVLETALKNNYSLKEREEALKYFGGCAFCGIPVAPRNDHLVSVMKCGDFIPQNVVPACQECDDSKGQKEFKEWMRSSNSKKSLNKRHGFTKEQIEKRIRLIEKWQNGYLPRTEKQLFGENYDQYLGLIKKMDQLCDEAKRLINSIPK